MKVVAQYVLKDEPCWGLVEARMMVPGIQGAEEHWVQDVTVIRGDRKAHYITDFGPAENFAHVTPLMMPSFGENSVAEMQEWAAKNRQDDYWHRRSEEMLAESTLVADVIRQMEQGQALIRNRSTFGEGVKVQRDGYSRVNTERKFREIRRNYYRKVQL